ncbi:MAG: cytochrome c biogenesis heme-transporting ATPase CcmA [Pseudomonadota bacterium]
MSSSKYSAREITLPQQPALIELRNFACERDERMLFNSLNALFYAGQVVQILGANGSGKTTLLRILAGVSSDYQGEILWQGQALATCAWEYANETLYLGHLPGIKKSLTPMENLRWYAAVQSSARQSDVNQVEKFTTGVNDEVLLRSLAEVNLAGYEDTLCYQLSAGQLRRVALARLVFSTAKLWILDEPFTALDKAGVVLLESRLASHATAGGVVLVTSHQDISVPDLQQLNLQHFTGSKLTPDCAETFANG